MQYYPIAIRLIDKRAVVVGGGTVAERKTVSLIAAGADVKVVSPTLTPNLKELAKRRRIEWKKGFVREGHLKGAHIMIAATSDSYANKKVSGWARLHKIPVNVVDEPLFSDFILPAIFKNGKAIVAVYTDGKDPVLSRDLKNFIKEHWDEFLSYRNRL